MRVLLGSGHRRGLGSCQSHPK